MRLEPVRDPDAPIDIRSRGAQVFPHCVAGMHLGRMFPRPSVGVFGSVLTVGADPGAVEDGIRHRHIPISYLNPDYDTVKQAIHWVREQLIAERTVLIRSEGGRQRPGLVVGGVVLDLGGTLFDATQVVRHGAPEALSDFRFVQLLQRLDRESR